MCSSNTFHHHVHDDERVDLARGLLCEGASLLVQTQESTDIIDSSRHLQQCLDKFDCALRLAPHLRAHAVRGWDVWALEVMKVVMLWYLAMWTKTRLSVHDESS